MHTKPETGNHYLNVPEVLLIRQLRHRGLRAGRIPGFFWSLKSCLLDNPGASLGQLNRRLEKVGWGDALLDEQTLQLARVAAIPCRR
jgi:hypothetical protein